MALQSSGQISLNDMHIEVGGTTGTEVSLNDTDIRDLIGKASGAQMAFNEWYGASAATTLTSDGGTLDGFSSRTIATASDYISSGGTLIIPSTLYLYSNTTATPALTVDIPCTIVNQGRIAGRGGNTSSSGGSAISITSTGVTIQNDTGAFIAGGGGGGSTALYGSQSGGGGAGGGSPSGFGGGGGWVLRIGTNSYSQPLMYGGAGKYSGGPTGTGNPGNGGYNGAGGGAAGGGGGGYGNGGGGAGGAINGGGGGGFGGTGSGGGGGWGAGGAGASSYFGSTATGSGGAAIQTNGNSYTLTNNGYTYGST